MSKKELKKFIGELSDSGRIFLNDAHENGVIFTEVTLTKNISFKQAMIGILEALNNPKINVSTCRPLKNSECLDSNDLLTLTNIYTLHVNGFMEMFCGNAHEAFSEDGHYSDLNNYLLSTQQLCDSELTMRGNTLCKDLLDETTLDYYRLLKKRICKFQQVLNKINFIEV